MAILRELFGSSREEIWRQLSAEIGADYVAGGFWKGDKVVAQHGQWTITLDTVILSRCVDPLGSWRRANQLPIQPGTAADRICLVEPSVMFHW